ncbi:hypothetical protein [Alloalcanivorax marinus]|uniref:hypothetical protein n=1 Tax=Alloalcanivorax marinus TaxID=1177169 RepID=UPI00195971E3|nr:hypothetical protein [Alloalcanivorax marinus]
MKEIIAWIESHGVTVDLLKWVIVGILAWLLGAFRFLKTKLKRPTLEIESLTSRCAWEELGDIDGNPANVRVTFLIQAGVNNPTAELVVIRDFSLHIRRLKKWPIWHQALNPTSLPCRVRHTVGDITRYLKNWFSNFSEGPGSLTLDGRIESMDFQSGFLVFVSASWGNMRPRLIEKGVPIKLKARLTTGETLYVKSIIPVLEDHSVMEGLVPGIFGHVENSSTWNIIRE